VIHSGLLWNDFQAVFGPLQLFWTLWAHRSFLCSIRSACTNFAVWCIIGRNVSAAALSVTAVSLARSHSTLGNTCQRIQIKNRTDSIFHRRVRPIGGRGMIWREGAEVERQAQLDQFDIRLLRRRHRLQRLTGCQTAAGSQTTTDCTCPINSGGVRTAVLIDIQCTLHSETTHVAVCSVRPS